MPELNELVAAVDGVGDDVSTAVVARYASVDDLAGARKADLQALPGVGSVLATRLLEAAREASGAAVQPAADDELPQRMRDALADAASVARPLLRVVEGGRTDETDPIADEVVDDPLPTPAPESSDDEPAEESMATARRNHPAGGVTPTDPDEAEPDSGVLGFGVRAVSSALRTGMQVYRTADRLIRRRRPQR